MCTVDAVGAVRLNRKLLNTPAELDRLLEELRGLPQPLRVGIDVLGGIAALAQAVLLEAGVALVHVPGLAVNRARQGTVGGESKSDPRDARVIAEQVRTRSDLRALVSESELDIELRMLVSRRHDLSTEQTRPLARMHDLLVGIFPELEHALDLTSKTALTLLNGFVTPDELRAAGADVLHKHLGVLARRGFGRMLVDTALQCAQRQHIAVPGQALTARLIKELANEALATMAALKTLEAELEERLARHPDAAFIRSLPGMGAVLSAEAGNIDRFRSADSLAAAAGLAPVLKQSGKSRRLRRPAGGNKGLKRVFYQSAFSSPSCPDSRAFSARKRQEGKRHRQALIALARRRVNVLWAILRNRQPFLQGAHQPS